MFFVPDNLVEITMLTRGQFEYAFCLAFDVEKQEGVTDSGFVPAETDLGSGKQLFGWLRLEGFAALAKLGFAKKLVIVGGDEKRYAGENPGVNRANVIREILIQDFDIDPSMVDAIPSTSNTGGNLAAIQQHLPSKWMIPYLVVTSFYHLPRVQCDLVDPMAICYPAEAFSLYANPGLKSDMIENLDEGELAERIVEEIQGIAHKMRGTYQPKTDEMPK